MTNTIFSQLDQAELLQLGINASTSGDSGSAIAYWKEAVGRLDSSAVAHYLLGAEYAQIKMYDRATGELEAALALDPALSIARLQLGLLWLSSGAAERATEVLGPLGELAGGDPLHHFGHGLLHLIGDRFPQASAALAQGIALNSGNAALNADMQRIIDEVAKLPEAAAAAKTADEGGGRHIFLSAYTGNGTN